MLGLSITEKYRALAADTHRRGFNCSQSVLFTLSDTVGLDKKTALLVSSSFGGGAKNSEICGAVSGALMAIGCKYGYIDPLYPNKEEFYDIVREFTRRFKEKHGTLTCLGLLGIDISRESGMQLAVKNDVFFKYCSFYIQDATEIALQLFDIYDFNAK